MKVPVIRADGYIWHHGQGSQDDLGYAPHEAPLEPVFRELLGGGVFLDVGAHVGHWSVRLARAARKVIAIEANPDAARVLRINIAMNKIPNIVVHEVAAWDSDTRLVLFNPEPECDRCGGTRVLTGQDGTVPAVRLDVLLAREQAVDLVKLDVEGADLHALEGMRGLLDRHRPDMIIERHDVYGYYQLEDLTALIADLRYASYAPPGEYSKGQFIVARPDDRI